MPGWTPSYPGEKYVPRPPRRFEPGELVVRAQIGARIRAARVRKDLTMTELGQAIGLSRVSMQNAEAGRHHLGIYKLLKIAAVLDVDPCFLLVGERDAS